MAEVAKLVTFDQNGESLREREVALWFTTDNGENEDEEGMYISLSSSADLRRELSGDVQSGVIITAKALARIGYYRALDLLDEETLLGLGYVKVFGD